MSREDLGRQATIAVTSTGPAAAVATLDALRREAKGDKDKALRTGAFDPDALTRRIEGLAPTVLVDPEMRKDLYAMVGRAISAGRATSLAALTAFHVEEAGRVLAPDRARHITALGTRTPGLNWAEPETLDLSTFLVENLQPAQAGGFEPAGLPETSPWPPYSTTAPYTVVAEGRHDMVVARLADGSTRELDIDTFVELVAADLARQNRPRTPRSCWPSRPPGTGTWSCRANSRTGPATPSGLTAVRCGPTPTTLG
ncbi:hypothetical protein NKH77_28875 [Streptomyces sp. M19]